MPYFKKIPVVVEAEQFNEEKALQHSKNLPFATEDAVHYGCSCIGSCDFCNRFWVYTMEGRLVLSDGDWVVKGSEGEFWPVNKNVFSKLYERVTYYPDLVEVE